MQKNYYMRDLSYLVGKTMGGIADLVLASKD